MSAAVVIGLGVAVIGIGVAKWPNTGLAGAIVIIAGGAVMTIAGALGL